MTQDVDLLALHAVQIAQELRDELSQRFRIAVRVREVGEEQRGQSDLADINPVEALPDNQRIGGILVMAPADLVASKVISYHQLRGKPKAGTDWRDLAMLLLVPELKSEAGTVRERLVAATQDAAILSLWDDIVTTEIEPESDEDEFW